MQKQTRNKPDIPFLENILEQTIVPVSPRPEFVEKLWKQLDSAWPNPSSETIVVQTDRRKMALISLTGLFAILAFVIAGFRTVAALLSALGLANEVSRQIKVRKTPPLNPVG